MSNERRWKKDEMRMLLLVVCGGNLEMKMMVFGRCKKGNIVKGWNLDGDFDC